MAEQIDRKPSFEIKTQAEEQAYRLGYIEGWGIAQVCALRYSYREMRSYEIKELWPWLRERSPRIGALPPRIDSEDTEK